MEIQAIKNLIALDEKLRQDAIDAHANKAKVRSQIEEEKAKLTALAWDEVKKQVEQTKAKIDAEINEKETDTSTGYQATIDRLKNQYQQKKDIWVQELTEYILGSKQ